MQDKNKDFVALLHNAHITQAELSGVLGITPTAVSRWHKIGVPQYARAYLLLRAAYIQQTRQSPPSQNEQGN